MGLREDLLRRIERKRQEITELKAQHAAQIAGEERYLQALIDTYKMVPRDGTDGSGPVASSGRALRKGGSTAKAYEALKRLGGPTLHIKDLLQQMGVKPTRTNYSSLSSALSAYARRGEIFTKPAPNTFGLVEFSNGKPETDEPAGSLLPNPEDEI